MSRERSGLTIGGSGDLPLAARTSSYDVVFDGVLFDRDKLVQRVGDAGDDAHLLLELYARFGTSILGDLRGAFALIVLDKRDRTVVATRDPLGMHPLFYASIDSALVFSWSIDGLLHAGAARDVNRLFVVEHLLRRWRAPDETYFTSIRRIPAGHFLHGRDTTSIERYWRDADGTELDNAGAWLDAFEQRLDHAVGRCLTLGRPGVYLSGGADSTNVAISAVHLTRDRGEEPPMALTVTFPDEESNEEEEQERIARALAMPRLTLAAIDPGPAVVERSLAQLAERCAPVGAIWDRAYQELGERANAAGCEVLLDGEGGDEWLTPPPQHAAVMLRRRELRRLARFAKAQRIGSPSAAWRYAARPLLHRALTTRLEGLSPALHARYRRRRHPLPTWIADDAELRTAVSAAVDAARPSNLWHPLSSMHLEDLFCTGRRLGIPHLHPLWDVDLVRFLASAPPEVLQMHRREKGLAVASARRRLTALGPAWPRRATAGALLDRLVGEALPRTLRALGGLPTLTSLGIVDASRLAAMIQKPAAGNALSPRDALAIFTAEGWLSRRLED